MDQEMSIALEKHDAAMRNAIEEALSPSQMLINCMGSTQELDKLLREGASLTAREPMSLDSALHDAADAGQPHKVRWLLDHGAPWSIKNKQGVIPAEMALWVGSTECYDMLMENAIQSEYERFYLPFDDEKSQKEREERTSTIDSARDNKQFLATPCYYMQPPNDPAGNAMVSRDGSGVIASWEEPIMKESARVLMEGQGQNLSVLNVGFGIGMIDTMLQSYKPSSHTIIEAHPDALRYLRDNLWHERPGVRIFEGTWQEAMKDPELGQFDAIYFDTFEEGYRDHLEFFSHVRRLLKGPHGRFSFFHNHGVKKEILRKIYADVLTMHMNDLGFQTTWTDVSIDPHKVWEGFNQEQRRYTGPWKVPLCMLAPTVPRTKVAVK